MAVDSETHMNVCQQLTAGQQGSVPEVVEAVRAYIRERVSKHSELRKKTRADFGHARSEFHAGCMHMAEQLACDIPRMLTAAQSENEELRARADACQQEAQIWKQEARAQSAIVGEIYQELTGRTGEPGTWNGARPLKPALLRKQAEAVETVAKRLKYFADTAHDDSECVAYRHGAEFATEEVNRLRQQADELEKAGGSHEA